MSKSKQAKLNADLSVKVANYIADNPDAIKNLPKDAHFVVFSKNDTKLNVLNNKLVKSLLKKGKKIITVMQTKNKETPWEFTFAS